MTTVKPEDLVKCEKYRVVRESNHNELAIGSVIMYVGRFDSVCGTFELEGGGVIDCLIFGKGAMLLEEYTPDTKTEEVTAKTTITSLCSVEHPKPCIELPREADGIWSRMSHPPKGGG